MIANNKLQNFLLTIFYYYSMSIGVSSYFYDHRMDKYKQTKFTKYYSVVVNVITVLTIPLWLWFSIKIVYSFELNLLMIYTNVLCLVLRALVLLYTSIFRWQREQQQLQLREMLSLIDPDYMSHRWLDQKINTRLTNMFYIKFAIFIYHNLSTIGWYIWLEKFKSWQKVIITILETNVYNILLCTMLNYFMYIWWVCLTYQQLNAKLYKLLAVMRAGVGGEAGSRHLLLELQHLRRVHWYLSSTVERLSRIYQFQMLANIFSCVVTNIANGYYGIMFIYVGRDCLKWPLVVLGSTTYITQFVDTYLLVVICDYVVESYRETSAILRNSYDFRMQRDLQNCCDQFALQLISRTLHINLCGILQVDKRNAFNIITVTIVYTILLLQFDYILRANK